jgi:hypothetical protein
MFQTVRDVAASHDTIMNLFERIHLFLQRLNRYTGMPLTGDLTGLLGKIMAQLLLILALSTKAMTDKRISELDHSQRPSFLAHHSTEKFLKKLAGKKEVEDAVLRLDTLTKEECLTVVARNLEVSYRVDGNVEVIDENVKATKALTEDVGDTVKATKALTEATKDGTQPFFVRLYTSLDLLLCTKLATDELKRLSSLNGAGFRHRT